MKESRRRVGFLLSGTPTDARRAALAWADDRYDVDRLRTGSLDASELAACDVVWWHRDRPFPGETEQRETVSADDAATLREYVGCGGGLLLCLRAMAAVTDLGFEDVPPDDVGVETVTAPTGPLWKPVHGGHPAVAGFDDYRTPVADRGRAPYARYRDVLPQDGEVLAATVAGGCERVDDPSVVAWHHGDGQVLGVAAPLTFETAADDEVAAARERFAAGLVEALVGDPDPRFDRPESGRELAALRRRIDDDHRPQYHLTPPANWLNDPNGLVRWNGRYHVFYQYNPGGPYHATIHWGHAVSDDLVTWEDERIALAPSPDGPDRDGCWSGCTVVDDGVPTLLYTGGRGRDQLPCLATTDDPDLRTWEKHPGNPVIDAAPTDLDVLETEHWRAEFRDHCVWREDGTWYHLVGSGISDVGGTAILYTGSSLTDWRYEGPVLVGDWDGAGPVWECPELLRFPGGDLLHVSNYEEVLYFVGDLTDGEFTVDRRGVLDHGDFYAPQSMRDGDRYLTWGWLPEARDREAQWAAGWSGAMSLPRVLDVTDDGLRQRPASEVTDRRVGRDLVGESFALAGGERRVIDTGGRALELELAIALESAERATLSVLESPDRAERTEIGYDRDGTLTIDRSRASRDPRATTDAQSMEVSSGDTLSLRVFVDGSVVELFANERHCLTSRVYPTGEDSTGVSLSATGGHASVAALSAWRYGSVWPGDSAPR